MGLSNEAEAARKELVQKFNHGLISLREMREGLDVLHGRVVDCGGYRLRVVALPRTAFIIPRSR